MSGFIGFLRSHVIAAFMLVGGPLVAIVATLNDAYTILTLGLPTQVWQALGAALFFAAVIILLYRFHNEHQHKDVKQQPTTQDKQQPKVQFWLPGNWETPIRHGTFTDKSGHAFPAEEIVLRIVAMQNLQNVRTKIKILKFEGVGDSGDRVITQMELPRDFGGSIPKGIKAEVLIVRRGFRLYETSRDNLIVHGRADLDTYVLPDTLARTKLDMPFRPFVVKVDVFHDDGPDAANFSVTSLENRPLTRIMSRNNVELVGER